MGLELSSGFRRSYRCLGDVSSRTIVLRALGGWNHHAQCLGCSETTSYSVSMALGNDNGAYHDLAPTVPSLPLCSRPRSRNSRTLGMVLSRGTAKKVGCLAIGGLVCVSGNFCDFHRFQGRARRRHQRSTHHHEGHRHHMISFIPKRQHL